MLVSIRLLTDSIRRDATRASAVAKNFQFSCPAGWIGPESEIMMNAPRFDPNKFVNLSLAWPLRKEMPPPGFMPLDSLQQQQLARLCSRLRPGIGFCVLGLPSYDNLSCPQIEQYICMYVYTHLLLASLCFEVSSTTATVFFGSDKCRLMHLLNNNNCKSSDLTCLDAT